MAAYGYLLLAGGWLVWLLPFFLAGRKRETAGNVDTRARWGMLLMAIAYSLLWQGKFWLNQPAVWRWWLCVLFIVLAAGLSWMAVYALGKHWRLDAGIQSGHELVTVGPYRFVRHPIYTSMLCMLLGTGFLITPVALLIGSVVVFVVGAEIRVRIEDRLLESTFGAVFGEYKDRVPAYIPFLWNKYRWNR